MASLMPLLRLVITFVFLTTSCQTVHGQQRKGSRAKKAARGTSEYCRDLHRLRQPSVLLIRLYCGDSLNKTSFREVRHESMRSEPQLAALRESRSEIKSFKKEHGLLNRLVHLLRKEYKSELRATGDSDSSSNGRRKENYNPLYLIRKWNEEHPNEG